MAWDIRTFKCMDSFFFTRCRIPLKYSTVILIGPWVGIKPGCSWGCQSPRQVEQLLSNQWTDHNHKGEPQVWGPKLNLLEAQNRKAQIKQELTNTGTPPVNWWGCVPAWVMLCLLSPLLWRWGDLFIDKSTLSTFHNRQVWKHSQEGDFWLGTSLVECGDPRPPCHKSHVSLEDPWQSTFLAPLLEAALLHFWWL